MKVATFACLYFKLYEKKINFEINNPIIIIIWCNVWLCYNNPST